LLGPLDFDGVLLGAKVGITLVDGVSLGAKLGTTLVDGISLGSLDFDGVLLGAKLGITLVDGVALVDGVLLGAKLGTTLVDGVLLGPLDFDWLMGFRSEPNLALAIESRMGWQMDRLILTGLRWLTGFMASLSCLFLSLSHFSGPFWSIEDPTINLTSLWIIV
jgi:hypothetical protein